MLAPLNYNPNCFNTENTRGVLNQYGGYIFFSDNQPPPSFQKFTNSPATLLAAGQVVFVNGITLTSLLGHSAYLHLFHALHHIP